jgi:hypothetical protein
MTTAGTAGSWRQSGLRSDRSSVAPRPSIRPDRGTDRAPADPGMRAPGAERGSRPSRPIPPLPPLRSAGSGREPLRAPEDDMAYGDAAEFTRSPGARRPAAARSGDRRPERSRPERNRADDRRPSARAGDPRSASMAPRGRTAPAAETGGGRMRGIVAVLGVFLVTLAGAAVDSLFMGMGLGLITLGSLVGSTVLAAALVRRRDLLSVVVAPPLVFVAVACANIALAPSASFNLATMATLLVRGFPTMAIATGAALVIALIRWAARR